MAHFLPLYKKGKTAADLVVISAQEGWNSHRLYTNSISNHNSQFTSEKWKEFLQLSGIRLRMSMAFYLQTDRQLECLNQTIKAYL